MFRRKKVHKHHFKVTSVFKDDGIFLQNVIVFHCEECSRIEWVDRGAFYTSMTGKFYRD